MWRQSRKGKSIQKRNWSHGKQSWLVLLQKKRNYALGKVFSRKRLESLHKCGFQETKFDLNLESVDVDPQTNTDTSVLTESEKPILHQILGVGIKEVAVENRECKGFGV